MLIKNITGGIKKFFTNDSTPLQVGLGLGFGFAFLFAFQESILFLIFFFIIFFVVKVNKISGTAGLLLFIPLAMLSKKPVIAFGYLLLEDSPGLYPFWVILRNTPFIPLTRFYNTAVMGGLAIGLAGFIPITLISSFIYNQVKKLNKKEKIARI